MADRVDALMTELRASPTPAQATAKAEELVTQLVSMYGEGMRRILEAVDDAGGAEADAVFRRLCDDKFVASLLILHDLHPLSTAQRVQAALARVRVYLNSHEGDVELLRIEDGVAYLKMAGSCNGCPSSAATMSMAIEKAVFEDAPEITAIRAEGVREKSSVQRRATDWVALDTLPGLDDRGIAPLEVDGTPVLFLRTNGTTLAYRNQCPACFKGLGTAAVAWPLLTCPSCGQAYDVVKAGRAPDKSDLWMEPFPLVAQSDRVQLAIPVTA